MKGGKADGLSDRKFDKYWLKIGTKVEMEHTDDRNIAKQIAKDHLRERPDYYRVLIRAGLADELKKESFFDAAVRFITESPEEVHALAHQYKAKHRGVKKLRVKHHFDTGETEVHVHRSYSKNLWKHLGKHYPVSRRKHPTNPRKHIIYVSHRGQDKADHHTIPAGERPHFISRLMGHIRSFIGTARMHARRASRSASKAIHRKASDVKYHVSNAIHRITHRESVLADGLRCVMEGADASEVAASIADRLSEGRRGAPVGTVHHRKDGDYQKGADKKWHEMTTPAIVANLVALHHADAVLSDDEADFLSDPHRSQLVIRYHKNHKKLNDIYKALARKAGREVKPGISRSLSTRTKGRGMADPAIDELGELFHALSRDPHAAGLHPEVAAAIRSGWPEDKPGIARMLAALHAHDPDGDPKLQHLAGLAVRRLMKDPKVRKAVEALQDRSAGEAADKLALLTMVKPKAAHGAVDPKSRPDLFAPGGVRLSRAIDTTFEPNSKWDPTDPHAEPYGTYLDPADRKRKSLWTQGHKAWSLNNKFALLRTKVAGKMAGLRSEIASDLGAGSRSSVAALMLWTIDKTWGRVGTDDTADKRGISLLRPGDVRIDGNTVSMSYVGKKGIKQSHRLELSNENTEARVLKAFRELASRAREYFFTDPKGTRISAEIARDYLMSKGMPEGFGPHAFRSYNATHAANRQLNVRPAVEKPTPKQAVKYLTKVLVSVDAKLGHKDALKKGKVSNDLYTYVDPRVIQTYMDEHGIEYRNPNLWTESVGGSDDVSFEDLVAIWRVLGVSVTTIEDEDNGEI